MSQSELKLGTALAVVASVGLAACSGGSSVYSESASPIPGQHQAVPTDPDASHSAKAIEMDDAPAPDGHGPVHWSYGGPSGAEHWAELSSDFAMCGGGLSQSPIDLRGAERQNVPPLELNYRSTNLGIVNNGHTIQVDHFGDSFVKIDRWPYRLRQFHFHAPSEHTVDGRHAAMEMHLVHVGEWGRLAVVGVMIEEGPHNPAFDNLWDRLPEDAGHPRLYEDQFVDPMSLLPSGLEFYHYTGSLTTPPCSEGVSWYVLQQPITMSADQIAQFTEIVERNSRPVQPLNGRKIYTAGR